MSNEIKRCSWVSSITEKYHDEEWGRPSKEDKYLFELFLLESFQAGLSWAIILKKREAFREAFDNFDVNKIAEYSSEKIESLLENREIVRSKSKISASISNAKNFKKIQQEFGSFSNYIWSFTDNETIQNTDEIHHTTTPLSDKIAKELKKRGMKFMGSVTTYAYLQAIGIVNNHEPQCFLFSSKI